MQRSLFENYKGYRIGHFKETAGRLAKRYGKILLWASLAVTAVGLGASVTELAVGENHVAEVHAKDDVVGFLGILGSAGLVITGNNLEASGQQAMDEAGQESEIEAGPGQQGEGEI